MANSARTRQAGARCENTRSAFITSGDCKVAVGAGPERACRQRRSCARMPVTIGGGERANIPTFWFAWGMQGFPSAGKPRRSPAQGTQAQATHASRRASALNLENAPRGVVGPAPPSHHVPRSLASHRKPARAVVADLPAERHAQCGRADGLLLLQLSLRRGGGHHRFAPASHLDGRVRDSRVCGHRRVSRVPVPWVQASMRRWCRRT